jgi:hypothetical protein
MPEIASGRLLAVSSLLWMIVCTILRVSMESKDPIALLLWALLLLLSTFVLDPQETRINVLSFIARVLSGATTNQEHSCIPEEHQNITPRNFDNTCLITQETIQEPAVVPCCYRSFEKSALKHWLRVSATCPNCRAPVTKLFVLGRANGTSSEHSATSAS